MLPNKLAPRRVLLSLRRRQHTVTFEDVAHGLVGYLMAKVGKGASDTVVAPTGIVLGHTHNELFDLGRDRRPSWPSILRSVELLRHELPVPAEHSRRSDDRADIFEGISAKLLAQLGESDPLRVVESDASFDM